MKARVPMNFKREAKKEILRLVNNEYSKLKERDFEIKE